MSEPQLRSSKARTAIFWRLAPSCVWPLLLAIHWGPQFLSAWAYLRSLSTWASESFLTAWWPGSQGEYILSSRSWILDPRSHVMVLPLCSVHLGSCKVLPKLSRQERRPLPLHGYMDFIQRWKKKKPLGWMHVDIYIYVSICVFGKCLSAFYHIINIWQNPIQIARPRENVMTVIKSFCVLSNFSFQYGLTWLS